VSFFSDERANELKDLFFESASELLQGLNEAGLELEQDPSNTETVRTIRRTVHTLKGDSAACGFRELSELAHALEDVLTEEVAGRANGATAQVVLTAADVFDSMLSAYRANMQPPSGNALAKLIEELKTGDDAARPSDFQPSFAWSEYERLVIEQGSAGATLWNVGIKIDPACAMRLAAMQLVHNVLQDAGNVLASHPESVTVDAGQIEAVLACERAAEWIEQRCMIPAITSAVVVRPYATEQSSRITPHMRPAAPMFEAPLPSKRQSPANPDTPAMGSAEAAPNNDDVLGIQAHLAETAPVNVPAQPNEEPAHERERQTAPVATENILRVDAERIDAVLNLVGELIIGKSMLLQAVNEFGARFPKDPLRGRFADMMAFQSQVLNELQRSVMKIRMVPVEQLFRRFPRVVRDVSKKEGKDVKLVMTGVDTDLDKSILDSLAEPLSHLVRNAVDHGIESPAERISAGKPAQATITLNAYHQANHVVIEVSDDGRGIDAQRVLTRAIERGVITAEQASRMTDAEIVEVIFEPGFSTAEQVTQISGRGVGLDVVKTVLERLKGSATVSTEPGVGSRFLLKVPLTLAIIRALLFRIIDKLYAVPLSSVVEITRARESEIHRVDGHEVLRMRDEVLTLIRLGRMDGRYTAAAKSEKVFVVVITHGDRKFGLVVDRLVGEEELVIKALDDHLVATELVSGASILGDGAVVLILNLAAVVEKFGRNRAVAATAGGQA
jgi:two-component system, chemotaxis family, sensor kinase CheA